MLAFLLAIAIANCPLPHYEVWHYIGKKPVHLAFHTHVRWEPGDWMRASQVHYPDGKLAVAGDPIWCAGGKHFLRRIDRLKYKEGK